eukprot:gene24977-211_t
MAAASESTPLKQSGLQTGAIIVPVKMVQAAKKVLKDLMRSGLKNTSKYCEETMALSLTVEGATLLAENDKIPAEVQDFLLRDGIKYLPGFRIEDDLKD